MDNQNNKIVYITLTEKEVQLRFQIRDTYFKWEKYNELLKGSPKNFLYKIKRARTSKFLIKHGIKVINE